MKKLLQQLQQLEGKGYKGYKNIQGHYTFNDFNLAIDYVQGDPFASPSKIRIVIPHHKRKIDEANLEGFHRKTATEDVLARAVGKAVQSNTIQIKGSGKSGHLLFDSPGQEVLERSADRKSTRLNSSHVAISYAVFCLKK